MTPPLRTTPLPLKPRNLAIAAVLVIGSGVGAWLVITGGATEPADDAPSQTRDGVAQGSESGGADATTTEEPAPQRSPLPLDDLSQPAVAELGGLAVPTDATEFLTARLDDDRQLDITFTMPAAAVDAFVQGSGLPEPVADQRVVLHSSPLWKLNPDAGTPVSGTNDTAGEVNRSVELVSEGDGVVRARVVLTSAI